MGKKFQKVNENKSVRKVGGTRNVNKFSGKNKKVQEKKFKNNHNSFQKTFNQKGSQSKKFNSKNKKSKNFINKQDNFQMQVEKQVEDEIIPVNNSDGFFNFDGETSIKAKLNNEKHLQNVLNNQTWDYKEIVKKEQEIRKMKEIKMKNEFKRQKDETIESTDAMETDLEINNNIKTETQIENSETNFVTNNINKFESELYSKDISFCDFNLSKLILRALANIEYFHPTKVQEKVIPLILKGNDVLINSETGSGKTACYLLPIIQKILVNKSSRSRIRALIILPTRELAFQCGEMLKKFIMFLEEEIRVVSICGGMAIENQINQLKNVPDILIATPGRLIDMLYNYKSENSSFLENINILVLDEADKLLELGFRDSIDEVLNIIKNNQNRQTLLFSATLNTKIIDLGKDALKNPVKIKINKSAILTNLKQNIVRMKFKKIENDEYLFEKRMAYVLSLLKDENQPRNRSIIFFNTKKECHKAFITLKKFDILSAQLHSDIPQPDRLSSLDLF